MSEQADEREAAPEEAAAARAVADPTPRLMRWTAVLGAAITAGSVFFGGWRVVAGCGAGVLLAVGNLWAIRSLVVQLLGGGRASTGGLFVVKMGLVFGLLYVLVRFVELSPIAIAVGFSSLVLVISASSLYTPRDDAVGAE